MPAHRTDGPLKGRGSFTNRASRFSAWQSEVFDDGWDSAEPPPQRLPTRILDDPSRSVVSWNTSPDIPFDRSVNPYKGCEHGCPYCYARPTHAYLDMSPGLDFETRVLAKRDAPALLRRTLAQRGYTPAPMALGANTDPYQPAERRLGITRGVLEVLAEARHPVVIVTKSALVERDLDILAEMAGRNLVSVHLSITTLDRDLGRRMEPRAAAPQRRLRTLTALTEAGIPAGVLFAPVIPALNDAEMESVLAQSSDAGAVSAAYVLLRLPREVEGLFTEWLEAHYPDRAAHVLSLVQQMRGGSSNDSRFGSRMRGTGAHADVIAARFRVAARRLGLDGGGPVLDCAAFRPPREDGQFDLFG
ncbi:PA0069 family radical SAM protein [Arhodomonas aquaeolei]|uniref:PA0069 family radical SAM protein n=1 Tax=Arhodomonas TaxID=2368 RepID=UPI00058D81A4|nr:PA0069 family radical SAM protein [Arhodomonas aquaeolei]MCS4503198.1 PA0069 family radical SAM protein [Arhodomonas aquaeolei]